MATRGKWWAALAQTGSAVRRHLLWTQMARLGFPGLPGPWTGGLWPGCRGRSLGDVLCLDCHSHVRPFCSCPSQLGGGAGRPEGQEKRAWNVGLPVCLSSLSNLNMITLLYTNFYSFIIFIVKFINVFPLAYMLREIFSIPSPQIVKTFTYFSSCTLWHYYLNMGATWNLYYPCRVTTQLSCIFPNNLLDSPPIC